LGRLKAFFDEGEVPKDISGLTRTPSKEPEELSIERGTFKWTAGGASKSTKSDKTSTATTTPSSASETEVVDEAATTASVSTRTAVDQAEQVFELKDITVQIVPRKLTVCLMSLFFHGFDTKGHVCRL
jgi:hypothetical protein